VNDDQFTLMTCSILLQPFFDVTTAENGLQAVQIVHTLDMSYFDLIVLDINMPIMDGMEACTRIDQYYKTGKVIDPSAPLEMLLSRCLQSYIE
jgi:CheY-like chemotaxis protein